MRIQVNYPSKKKLWGRLSFIRPLLYFKKIALKTYQSEEDGWIYFDWLKSLMTLFTFG